MPKCPYCSEELRIKLTGLFVSKIDDEYWSLFETFVQRMPRLVKWAFKSHLGQKKDAREIEYPPLVNLLVCSYCDSVISAEMQKMGSSS